MPLFDGKTLTGWDFNPEMWSVQDGLITGGSTTEKITKNDFISTQKSYSNFELKLKIKVSGDPKTGMLNSGIQIRSLRDGAAMSGYQIDCGAGWFGKIYDEHRRNKVIWSPTPEQQAALDKAIDVFGWNEYTIRAEGPRIQTWINGVHCIDYTETDPNIALDGHIAPQVHSGGICLVQVKDVTIEELPPTPDAPTWKSIGGLEGMKAKLPPKPQANAATKPKRDISYNDVQGTALSAQEQLKKFKLPEGYEIELVVQESEDLGKFVSVYFDQRGRLWTQTALEYPIDANENPAAAEAAYKAHGKDKVLVYPRESLNAPLPPSGLTNPTVFAEGLAIPLGILPWGNGDTCYVQHGHDLKLYKDTNADGKADTHDVVLTGFGVQDSHLFPHQFTRAPGGWIWMAQGLFNNSQVRKPGSDTFIDWPKCSMARMRPDGSEFEVISTGPNNIWGLVITGEGETFIQEANDYGYPIMPFHEYAYYPGGMEALKKSYQPDFPPQAEFRMGGTGLSGLALIESGSLSPTKVASALAESSEPAAKAAPTYSMAVANPITSKIQTLAMHRDGPYWKLEQLPDLITCDDPFFRPVALTNGPDGCIYIVDWYNKIISHNEVPRAHPDRDKTRGRIWRIKSSRHSPSDESPSIPDFTQLPTEDLIALLGKAPVAKAHLAWQALVDRWNTTNENGAAPFEHKTLLHNLRHIAANDEAQPTARIQSLWSLHEMIDNHSSLIDFSKLPRLLGSLVPSVRMEAVSALGRITDSIDSFTLGSDYRSVLPQLMNDPAPTVRQAFIKSAGRGFSDNGAAKETEHEAFKDLELLLFFAKPSLPNGPTIQSSRGNKQIPAREAYDREFERFLVRMFLERHPDLTATFLDSEAAAKLPVEARVLASLALDPKTSASRVAKLLPQLDRAPNDEELLRLAQFPTEPGVAEALTALLTHETSRASVAEKLLTHRTKLDPKQIAPLLTTTARDMLHRDVDTPVRTLALQLISGFQLTTLEPDLVTMARSDGFQPSQKPALLTTLRDLRSAEFPLFATLAESDPDPLTRAAAVEALAASRAPDAPTKLLALFPKLTPAQRKNALNTLSTTKSGATTIVAALLDKSLPQSDLDAPTIERLATILSNDPAIEKLQQQLGGLFQEVLLLDGSDDAWIDSNITLDGPFTIEAWVRLAPGIGNEDSLLGSPKGLQLNFFGSKFRAYAGPELRDVAVATKPMTPDLWTHLAVTRDTAGIIRIYQNGELDATATKPSPAKWEDCQIAWSGPSKGTEGALTEFRVWKTARTPAEIRAAFDRTHPSPKSYQTYPASASKLAKGARLAKTLDTPPLLSTEQALALDTQFTKLTALAAKGDPAAGKPYAALCLACHQIGNAGGQIGPNLSGVGSMGLEAILRNILTPNAAMEPGYRIYRVELKNGDLIDAFFVSEDKDAIVIRQPGAPDRRLPKAEVARTQFIRRSLMPEGLLTPLPDQTTADLLAYLMTLKG
jgi:putative membrane-bound dehydrogenase-like protein